MEEIFLLYIVVIFLWTILMDLIVWWFFIYFLDCMDDLFMNVAEKDCMNDLFMDMIGNEHVNVM